MNTLTKQDWNKLDKLYNGMESSMINWCIAVSHLEGQQEEIGDHYGIDHSNICMMAQIGDNANKFFIEKTLIANLPSGYNSLYQLTLLPKREIKKLCKISVPTRKSIRDLKTELGLLPAPKVKPTVTSATIDKGLDPIKAHIAKTLPQGTKKSVINKVKKGMDTLAGELKKEFSSAVNKAVTEKVKVRQINMQAAQDKAKAEFERTIKMAAGVKAFMTREEFMLIRACLHPDKNPHPKAADAFKIFNRLADVKKW